MQSRQKCCNSDCRSNNQLDNVFIWKIPSYVDYFILLIYSFILCSTCVSYVPGPCEELGIQKWVIFMSWRHIQSSRSTEKQRQFSVVRPKWGTKEGMYRRVKGDFAENFLELDIEESVSKRLFDRRKEN